MLRSAYAVYAEIIDQIYADQRYMLISAYAEIMLRSTLQLALRTEPAGELHALA